MNRSTGLLRLTNMWPNVLYKLWWWCETIQLFLCFNNTTINILSLYSDYRYRNHFVIHLLKFLFNLRFFPTEIISHLCFMSTHLWINNHKDTISKSIFAKCFDSIKLSVKNMVITTVCLIPVVMVQLSIRDKRQASNKVTWSKNVTHPWD